MEHLKAFLFIFMHPIKYFKYLNDSRQGIEYLGDYNFKNIKPSFLHFLLISWLLALIGYSLELMIGNLAAMKAIPFLSSVAFRFPSSFFSVTNEVITLIVYPIGIFIGVLILHYSVFVIAKLSDLEILPTRIREDVQQIILVTMTLQALALVSPFVKIFIGGVDNLVWIVSIAYYVIGLRITLRLSALQIILVLLLPAIILVLGILLVLGVIMIFTKAMI